MHKYFPVLKYANIPNIITSFSIGMGLLTLILFAQKNFSFGIALYALTLLFDRIDGAIARRFKMETVFGKELDSLSDAVNFSVIPALIAYFMGFNSIPALLVLFLYVLSGIWRLANFNLDGLVRVGGKSCFTGLCTTHAGGLFLLGVSLYLSFFREGPVYFMYPLFFTTALLMNASFRYDKNGWFTKFLYAAVPAAVIMAFISI